MIKKILLIILAIGLASYFIAAITIFNKPEQTPVCTGVEILVDDSLNIGFIKEKDIEAFLKKEKLYPGNQPMDQIDLLKIEQKISNSPYIESAICYKTATGKVAIKVKPHNFILHVISDNGESYYLDSNGNALAKSKYHANLPIVTGAVTKKYAKENLVSLGQFIQKDPFWDKQIEQIEVLSNGDINIIPRVGHHVIALGSPLKFKDKLLRMQTFYKEGLNKVGWNKYSTITLEYNNQIICTKK